MLYADCDLGVSINLNKFDNNAIDRFAEAILSAMLVYDHFYCAMKLWCLRDQEKEFNALRQHNSLTDMFKMADLKKIKRKKSWLISNMVNKMPLRLDTSFHMVDMLDDIQNGLILLYIEMRMILSGYMYLAYLKQTDKDDGLLTIGIKYLSVFSAMIMTKNKGKGYIRLAETFGYLVEHTNEYQLTNMRHRFQLI